VRFAERLDEHEEYSAKARQSLSTMSLLGVVAGFMTHESKAAVHDLEQAVTIVRRLEKRNPELRELTDDLEKRLENFRNYLDYSQMFIRKVRDQKIQPLSAAGQVRYIMNTFKDFAERRGIEVIQDIAGDVTTPPLPVTVYSGLLLNLYTNALKAVIAAKSSVKTPKVLFRAWNDSKHHFVEVADNGIGIPTEVRSRIWDPLYTTTSDEGNPLGSGMGLGLTLVDQVVKEFKGTVSLLEKAPPEFTTCFRLTFPLR
jgi:signal transduction histidine kinase